MALEDHDGEQILQRLEQATRRIAVAQIVAAVTNNYGIGDAINVGVTPEHIASDIVKLANEICKESSV